MTYTQHSQGFKARMVQRMSGREGISASALAREVGIDQPTLSGWLREATSLGRMTNDRAKDDGKQAGGRRKSPADWPIEEKLRVVAAAAHLSNEDLGAFLRREGLHEAQLTAWREAILAALGGRPSRGAGGKRERSEPKALRKELDRKGKALAEVATLLALQNKGFSSGLSGQLRVQQDASTAQVQHGDE